jgi:hypothetical protein
MGTSCPKAAGVYFLGSYQKIINIIVNMDQAGMQELLMADCRLGLPARWTGWVRMGGEKRKLSRRLERQTQ